MAKIIIIINTNKMHNKSIWVQKSFKIVSRKAYPGSNFLRAVSVPSSRLPPGGPRTPKIMTKSQKTPFLNHFVHAHLHLLQHEFCLAKRIQGESHCNNSRLEYLPGLGKVKMLTQVLGGLFWGCGDDPPQASSIDCTIWPSSRIY